MAELEIVGGPLVAYWAPVGETFPVADAAVAGNWTKIGTSGEHNYHEDGVTIVGERSNEAFRALGSPYPRKFFTPTADLMVRLRLADMSLAEMRLAVSNNTVATSSPEKTLELDVGLEPTEIALLVRGVGLSPELDGGDVQYELPRCIQSDGYEHNWNKGGPVITDLEFTLVYDEGNSNPAGLLNAEIA